jgi:hypothetical protein
MGTFVTMAKPVCVRFAVLIEILVIRTNPPHKLTAQTHYTSRLWSIPDERTGNPFFRHAIGRTPPNTEQVLGF